MTATDAQKLRDGMIAAADAIGDNDRNAANAYRDCASRVGRFCQEPVTEAPKRRKAKPLPEPKPPEAPQPYMGEPAKESVVDKFKGVFSDD